MIGFFTVQFGDGSIGNKSVGLWFANITLSNGTRGSLTMTAPLNKTSNFFIDHDCLQMQGAEPQQRCSLIVPNCNGYKQYVYKAPELVAICPESTTSPGVEEQTIERSG